MIFLHYLLVQVVAYAIDMGTFLLVFYSGMLGALGSNVMGKVIAGLFAFVTHQVSTFHVPRHARKAHQALRYFILLGINVPLSSVVLALVLQLLDYATLAKFVSDAICVSLTFWISKKWVFSFSHGVRGEQF
ncbi:GtrA family protein [Candidatus Thiosymbion oneisti]|uniref:GtrA family protein n=1 Tax=Candidatus Thiosymbion oneisti TaxID=589554 RepID=UPI001060F4D2|nr:GtrA family protein [Candidatus Thiosymbion oneisti]